MLHTVLSALPPWPQAGLGAGILLAAGLLRGFTGYGFAITAVPLLSLVCPPSTAVPIVVVLQVLISLDGLPAAVRGCDRASVALLAVAATLATPVGVLALAELPDATVRLCIAAIVAGATVVLGRGVAPERVASRAWTGLFGAVAGLFNGLAGMPGPPVIACYLAAGVGSARARASMIVLFLLTSAVALPPLALAGALTPGRCALAVAAFPLVWLASRMGGRLHRRASERTYRRTGLVVLGATALVTAGKALTALG